MYSSVSDLTNSPIIPLACTESKGRKGLISNDAQRMVLLSHQMRHDRLQELPHRC